jgi:glycosyltransferase involved in cell wall biosynthesis
MNLLDGTNSERYASLVVKRPRLLFLACFFPPVQASGAVRARNIAKYLARLGWEVTVVTPDPSVWRNVEDPEKVSMELDREGIKRILTGHRWRCLEPDHLRCWNRGMGWVLGGLCRRFAGRFGIENGVGWVREAERACSTLTSDRVDVILASGAPFASFTLARHLSAKLGRPYVLDYRDPWVRPDHVKDPAMFVICQREAALVQSSSGVTAVAKSFFNGRSGFASKVHVITNGFDPEEMASITAHDFGHFAIVYAGVFQPPQRTITPVMRMLRRFKDEGISRSVQWRFHYYGSQGDYVQEEAKRFCVAEHVVLHGRVARREALSAVKGSAVTIVITSVLEERVANDGWIITGKLFEPLGLGVPTLLIGPSGSDAEDIVETSGLACAVTASNVEGMLSFLKAVLSGGAPKPKAPETYAWPNIIGKMDLVLCNAMSVKTPV